MAVFLLLLTLHGPLAAPVSAHPKHKAVVRDSTLEKIEMWADSAFGGYEWYYARMRERDHFNHPIWHRNSILEATFYNSPWDRRDWV